MANIKTPAFRVSFPNLFQPGKGMARDDGSIAPGKYGVTMLFPKDADLTELKAEVNRVLLEKFGSKERFPKGMRSPFRDQGDKEFQGYEEGSVFLNCSSKNKPGVVDQRLQEIVDPAEIYAGCWARASVRAYYYDKAGNKGVAFGLQNIQKLKDDKPLDGRIRATEEFEAVETAAAGGGDDFDPFAE